MRGRGVGTPVAGERHRAREAFLRKSSRKGKAVEEIELLRRKGFCKRVRERNRKKKKSTSKKREWLQREDQRGTGRGRATVSFRVT